MLANNHQKRSPSGNQQRLLRKPFPSKLKNDFSHFVTVRYEFLMNQLTEYWTMLPNSMVNAPSLDIFKARLDSLKGSDYYY